MPAVDRCHHQRESEVCSSLARRREKLTAGPRIKLSHADLAGPQVTPPKTARECRPGGVHVEPLHNAGASEAAGIGAACCWQSSKESRIGMAPITLRTWLPLPTAVPAASSSHGGGHARRPQITASTEGAGCEAPRLLPLRMAPFTLRSNVSGCVSGRWVTGNAVHRAA